MVLVFVLAVTNRSAPIESLVYGKDYHGYTCGADNEAQVAEDNAEDSAEDSAEDPTSSRPARDLRTSKFLHFPLEAQAGLYDSAGGLKEDPSLYGICMDACPSALGFFDQPCDCLSKSRDATTFGCPAPKADLTATRSAALQAKFGAFFPASYADTAAHDCVCEYDGRKCWERSYPTTPIMYRCIPCADPSRSDCVPQEKTTIRCVDAAGELVKSMDGFDKDCNAAAAASVPWRYGSVVGGRTRSFLPTLHPGLAAVLQTRTASANLVACKDGAATIKTTADMGAVCTSTLSAPHYWTYEPVAAAAYLAGSAPAPSPVDSRITVADAGAVYSTAASLAVAAECAETAGTSVAADEAACAGVGAADLASADKCEAVLTSVTTDQGTTCAGTAWAGSQAACLASAGTCAGAVPAISGTTTRAACEGAATTAGTFTGTAMYVRGTTACTYSVGYGAAGVETKYELTSTLKLGQSKEQSDGAGAIGDATSGLLSTVMHSVQDIRETGWAILVAGMGVAFVLTIFWIALLKCCVKPLVYLTLILVFCVILLAAVILFYKGGFFEQFAAAAELSSQANATGLAVAAADEQIYWSVGGWAATVVEAAFVVAICYNLSKIQQATSVIKEASNAMKDMPLLLVFPFLPLVLGLLMAFYWMLGAMLILTAEEITLTKIEDSITTAASAASGAVGAGNVTVALLLAEPSSAQQDLNLWLFWFHLLGWLWAHNLILAVTMTTIAGACSFWYFTPDRADNAKVGCSFCRALGRVLRYHLGSMIFGALIIALIQLARAVLAYIDSQTKGIQGKNACYRCLMKVVQCVLWCFEKCVQFLTRRAYIHIAIKGTSFCSAAKSGFMTILGNLFIVGFTAMVSTVLLLLGKIAIAATAAVFIYYYLTRWGDFTTDEYTAATSTQTLIHSTLPSTIVTAVLAYMTRHAAPQSSLSFRRRRRCRSSDERLRCCVQCTVLLHLPDGHRHAAALLH
jgi:hypothetical protein